MQTGLIKYDTARQALQEAHTIDEVKDVRDKAEALRLYAQQAKDREMAVWAAEIKCRAEMKAGELIQKKQESGEIESQGGDRRANSQAASLKDIGVTHSESSRWQQAAAVPEEKFEAYIAECKEKNDVPTSAGVRRLNAEERREERLAEISQQSVALDTGKRYPVIYADPPWQYENPPIGATNRAIENHYPTMTLDQICALPVADLATDDAVLFLWATAPKLAECMAVIEAWGFTYRTCMVWVKDKIGMGYHVRNQHEILLIAKRGQVPPPTVEARVSSVLQAPRGQHSAKPLEFYGIIEAMYPGLERIELFCRDAQEGWAVWGNQSGA